MLHYAAVIYFLAKYCCTPICKISGEVLVCEAGEAWEYYKNSDGGGAAADSVDKVNWQFYKVTIFPRDADSPGSITSFPTFYGFFPFFTTFKTICDKITLLPYI